MTDIYLDVNTAVTVPVNVLPLTDDSDFKTRKTAIAYNESGMDLVWNFITTAGVITQTAVTPTSGGDYDWTHIGDGMYKIEIPATGGASINNDATGFGWFTGIATGVLPWRSPVVGFRSADINNEMIDGSGILNATVEGGYTVLEVLQVMVAVMAGKVSGGGTGTISFRDLTDSLNRVVASVDANGNRTAITIS